MSLKNFVGTLRLTVSLLDKLWSYDVQNITVTLSCTKSRQRRVTANNSQQRRQQRIWQMMPSG